MSQCIYYIPRTTVNIDKVIAELGLPDRLTSFGSASVDVGPGGKPGILLSFDGHGLLHQPDKQTWVGPFNDGRLWVGVWNDRRPGPNDLKRPEQSAGTRVKLLDGNEWLIPTWRAAPVALTIAPDGTIGQEPLALRKRLAARIEQIANLFEEDATAEIDLAELLGIIADVLSVNYRIGTDPAQELSLLRLVSTVNFKAIVDAVLDMEFLKTMAQEAEDDAAKKNGDLA